MTAVLSVKNDKLLLLAETFGEKATMAYGELTLTVPAAEIIDTLKQLRDGPDTLCKTLIDISGVDYLDRPERFDIVYHLLSYKHNLRVRVRICTDESSPVPSVVSVFPSADWYEREIWDLYGVAFEGHPDLRRILTDYGFSGHPLRKDFPLTGYVELRYSEEHKRVVYEPVTLTQDFRQFDFLSPWEGAKYVLPTDIKLGDEKAVVPAMEKK